MRIPSKKCSRVKSTRRSRHRAFRASSRVARFESLEARLPLSASSIGGKSFVDVGPSDNVAWDQPRVTVQFLTGDLDPLRPPSGANIVGPNTVNSWLLDTGANTTLAFQTAVEDMENSEPAYQTDGKFFEIGVGGFQEFDISESYTFDFAGTKTNQRNRLTDARIISDPTRDVSIAGPYGIAGMPLMTERVTTLDFTPWLDLYNGGFLMETDFRTDVPDPVEGASRYTVSVDNRLSFDTQEGLDLAGNPLSDAPMWADVPFMTGQLKNNDLVSTGDLLFDTGAQVSILSSRMAFELGLDTNQDGELNELDAGFARNEAITGVGGLTNTPVFLIDEVHIPTDQGPDLVWTDLQWLILDIYEGIDGVFGFDNMTSGWIENFGIPGNAGYLLQAHLDFLDYETEVDGLKHGKVHFDLNQEFLTEVNPGSYGATVVESAGSTIVSESAHDDTYQLSLNTQPTADVIVSFVGNNSQVFAVDDANPENQFVTFTTDNWNAPQTVRVSGGDDSSQENFRRAFIRNLSSSDDPNYDGVGMPRVSVGVIDDDLPGVMIIPSGGETVVSEAGDVDTYEIVLTYPPTLNVAIDLEHVAGQITAENLVDGTNSLIFTADNWFVPQTVKVTAVDDLLNEGDHNAFVSHKVVTSDTEFQINAFALQEKVSIVDNDNDLAGLIIARDDLLATVEDTPLVVSSMVILGNDVTEGIGPVSVEATLETQPANGVVTNLAPDGSFTYTPNEDFHGGDAFQYRISGGDGTWDVGTVRIEVGTQVELDGIEVGDQPSSQTDQGGVTSDQSRSLVDQVRVRLDGPASFARDAIAVERVEGNQVISVPVEIVQTSDQEGRTIAELGFAPGSSQYVNQYGSLVDGAYRVRIDGQNVYGRDSGNAETAVVNSGPVGSINSNSEELTELLDLLTLLGIDSTELDGLIGGSEEPVSVKNFRSNSLSLGTEVVDDFYVKFGDEDYDGKVGLADFAIFRSAFGTTDEDASFADGLDYDRDDRIGLSDFAAFRSVFGT